jgi:hypothetical protein
MPDLATYGNVTKQAWQENFNGSISGEDATLDRWYLEGYILFPGVGDIAKARNWSGNGPSDAE